MQNYSPDPAASHVVNLSGLNRPPADSLIYRELREGKSSRTDLQQLRVHVAAAFPGQWRDRRFLGKRIFIYLGYLDTRVSLDELSSAVFLSYQETADEINRIHELKTESEVMAKIIAKIRDKYIQD